MDDLLKRALQTIGFVLGMMLLVYALIATGSEKPAMLTLVYYNFMNRVFAALWWFIKMVVLVAGIVGVAFAIFQVWKAKRNEKAEKELKLRQDELCEKEKRIWEEEEKTKLLELKTKAELEELQNHARQIEKDLYLKNRSAEEANQEALKHFL